MRDHEGRRLVGLSRSDFIDAKNDRYTEDFVSASYGCYRGAFATARRVGCEACKMATLPYPWRCECGYNSADFASRREIDAYHAASSRINGEVTP